MKERRWCYAPERVQRARSREWHRLNKQCKSWEYEKRSNSIQVHRNRRRLCFDRLPAIIAQILRNPRIWGKDLLALLPPPFVGNGLRPWRSLPLYCRHNLYSPFSSRWVFRCRTRDLSRVACIMYMEAWRDFQLRMLVNRSSTFWREIICWANIRR